MARPVLLYDADCRLCRFTARVVARLDRRRSLALLGLEDAPADRLLEHVSEDERGSSLRLVLPDGRLLSAGAAALGVLERLPATRPLARLGRERLFLRPHGTLGRLVPDGSARDAP